MDSVQCSAVLLASAWTGLSTNCEAGMEGNSGGARISPPLSTARQYGIQWCHYRQDHSSQPIRKRTAPTPLHIRKVDMLWGKHRLLLSFMRTFGIYGKAGARTWSPRWKSFRKLQPLSLPCLASSHPKPHLFRVTTLTSTHDDDRR